MFSYFAYGLTINSEIEIPEFVADGSLIQPDVTISVDKTTKLEDYLSAEALECPWGLSLNRERGVIYIKDLGVFKIDHGSTVVFMPAQENLEQQARCYLVGTVMAILLYQRRFLVLHGSVIEIAGEAVIFLGNSGDGKSTTAAALHTAGFKLVNDDVAPIVLSDRPAYLEPGFPQIKMSQETATALGYDFESLPLIHADPSKRGYRPRHNFSRSPLNIKRIYVLDYGSEFASTPIASSLATMELSRHSRPTTLYHRGDAEYFFQCVNLVKEHTIYRLQRPKDLALLPKFIEFIKQDLALEPQMAI